jgi:hypothetical protein
MSQRSIAFIKITLDWIEPAVPRRLEVPLDLRLDRLHQTVQAAMGWTDSHLWGFEAGGATFGPPMPDDGFGDTPINARKVTLKSVLEDTGRKTFHYTYDYGDNWEHVIKVETIGNADPDVLYPRLLAASGACPPEDVGGAHGYEEFLAALDDPGYERHEEFVEWYGDTFDPTAVDTDAIKAELSRLAKRWNRKPPVRKPTSR